MKILGKLLIPYWAICFVLTHLPPSEVPQAVSDFDKAFHFCGYTLLGFLFYAHGLIKGAEAKGLILRGVLVLAAYSLFDEWTQPYVGRAFEWLDLLVDFLGIVLGTSSAWWVLTQTRIFPAK